VWPLGPGSRARPDIVRKIGTEARAWPGHESHCRDIPIHNIEQHSLLRSRGAFARPGFAFLFSIHPDEGRVERRKGASGLLSRVSARDGPRLLRRGASHGGGTLASRRSTVAILGRGPRFPLRHFLRIRAASSSQPGRSAWRAGSRTSRGLGYEPRPQDATPRSAFGTSPETAPQMSEDSEY
jgi:hypothetical protein